MVVGIHIRAIVLSLEVHLALDRVGTIAIVRDRYLHTTAGTTRTPFVARPIRIALPRFEDQPVQDIIGGHRRHRITIAAGALLDRRVRVAVGAFLVRDLALRHDADPDPTVPIATRLAPELTNRPSHQGRPAKNRS